MMQKKATQLIGLYVILLTAASLSESSLQVSVVTFPNAGPKYAAGDLVYFICQAENGVEPYTYSWSIGCSFTNTMTKYSYNSSVLGPRLTISKDCENSYTCTVTDDLGVVASASVVIEIITDLAIVITTDTHNFVTANITILAANTSGRFHDMYCGSGLSGHPNLGKWIHPNGNEITALNQKYAIEKGGGINSFPYITLSLKDGYSLSFSDYGIYRCKMLDNNMVEREKHIWILPEQEFDEATPENFTSYSGTESVTLYSRYSNTPGKIHWEDLNKDIELIAGNNDSLYYINQHLLQTDPVLYEGVLELKQIANGLMRCTILNRILNSSSSELSQTAIGRNHYFFLRFIGQSQPISCSFSHDDLLHVQIILDGQVIASSPLFSSSVSYTIPKVTDDLHNNEYDCVATTLGGTKDSLTFTLVGLIPDNALTMHVQQPQVTEAGQNLQVILSAIKLGGFTHDQLIACTNQIGTPLENINGISFNPANPTHTGLTLQYTVPINPVKLSHAGLYLCTATLETAHQMDNITDHTNFNITVTIPIPLVTLNNGGTSNGKVGSIAEFNCTSTFPTTSNVASYLDIPIVPKFKWTVNRTEITSQSTRYYVSETTSVGDIYYSTLNIVPLLKEDESTITCTAQMTPSVPNQYIIDSQAVGQASLVLSVEGSDVLRAAKLIQIQLTGIQSQCSQWMVNANSHLESITNIIVDVIKDRCGCQYTIHYITDQQFTCSVTNEGITTATYRASIYRTDTTEVNTIQGYLQDWVSSNPQIVLDSNTQVMLNTDCIVDISSLNDPLCEVEMKRTTIANESTVGSTNSITSTTLVNVNSSNRPLGDSEGIDMTQLIGGGCVLLLIILVVITIVGIGVCVLQRRKKKRKQHDLRKATNFAAVNNLSQLQQSSLYPPPPPEAQPYQTPHFNYGPQSSNTISPPSHATMATTSLNRTLPSHATPLAQSWGLPRPAPANTCYRNIQSDYDQWNHQDRNLPEPPKTTNTKEEYYVDKYHNKTVQYKKNNFKEESYVDMDYHRNSCYNRPEGHYEDSYSNNNKPLYESMDNYRRS